MISSTRMCAVVNFFFHFLLYFLHGFVHYNKWNPRLGQCNKFYYFHDYGYYLPSRLLYATFPKLVLLLGKLGIEKEKPLVFQGSDIAWRWGVTNLEAFGFPHEPGNFDHLL